MYILKVKARSFNLNLRSYTLKSAPGRSVSSWSTTIIGFSRECVLFLSDPWILSYMTTCTTDIIGTWHILKMPSWSQRPTQLASKGAMKCPRLHVYLVLGATVRSAESFQLTGICSARSGIVAIDRVAAQQRSIDSTASSGRSSGWSTATCRHREGCRSSRTTLKMGSANKKKRKLEKEALKEGGSRAKLSAVQAEADDIADGLLDKCVESERNMAAISAVIENLRSLSTTLRPAQSYDLNTDWRLVFASDDDALCAVGTGLHKLPLTRMQDFFLTMSGGSSSRKVRAIEVLRVLGPFPNVRNTLDGQCISASPDELKIRYTSMIDGTGKKTGSSSTGELDRVVDVSVAFVGRNALVFTTHDAKRKGDNKEGSLVFTRERDLDLALAELRVDGIEEEDEE